MTYPDFIIKVEHLLHDRLKPQEEGMYRDIALAFKHGAQEVCEDYFVTEQDTLLLSFVEANAKVDFDVYIHTMLLHLNAKLQEVILSTQEYPLGEDFYAQTLEGKILEVIAEFEFMWCRMLHVALNDAYQVGRACGIKTLEGHDNPYVFKSFSDKNTCTDVDTSFYGKKGNEKMYMLQDLLKNGINNTTRKSGGVHNTEWKPVLGSTHPWCVGIIKSLKLLS